jgi:hypothetical protein
MPPEALGHVDGEQHQHQRHEHREQRAPRHRREVDPRRGAKQQRRHEDVVRGVGERAGRVAAVGRVTEPAQLADHPSDRDDDEDREQLEEHQRRHRASIGECAQWGVSRVLQGTSR